MTTRVMQKTPDSGARWTRFMDMHSGGGTKVPPYNYIYIELPEEKACAYFEREFGRDPDHCSCDTCGSDYAISSAETLEQATAFERGCAYDREVKRYIDRPQDGFRSDEYCALDEFVKRKDVLVVRVLNGGAA